MTEAEMTKAEMAAMAEAEPIKQKCTAERKKTEMYRREKDMKIMVHFEKAEYTSAGNMYRKIKKSLNPVHVCAINSVSIEVLYRKTERHRTAAK